MRYLATVILFIVPAVAQTCSVGTVGSACPTPETITAGVVSNTAPSVTAFLGSYSTMANSAARVYLGTYLTGDSVTSTTGSPCVLVHGGGDSAGGVGGEFLFSTYTESLVYPVQLAQEGENYCRAVISVGFTMYAGGLGSAGTVAAAMSDLRCALRWVAHNAGTLFPGNKDRLRIGGFSFGAYFAELLAWNASAYPTTCEWSDSYTILPDHGLILLSPLHNIAGQWATAADSMFVTAIQNVYGSCTGGACPPLFAAYDPHALGLPSASSVQLGALVDGAADTTTNPTYQYNVLVSDESANARPAPSLLQNAPAAHGGTCKTAANVWTDPCFPFLMSGFAGAHSTGAANISFGSGVSF